MLRRPRIELKTPEQIELMRAAGLVVDAALRETLATVRPGISTADLDGVAATVIRDHGAEPNFLGYGADDQGQGGFAGVVCLSVNDEVVHGVPGARVLAEGDLLSVDCGAIVQGWHADAARSTFAGEPVAERLALSEATRRAMWAGIGAAALGARVGDVSAAVAASVAAEPRTYGIVADYVGHGIGSAMHQPPDVPNTGRAGRGPKIVSGMVLCIEPMLTLGAPDCVEQPDGWTVVTQDGGDACQWENMITCTPTGTRVLTEPDEGRAELAALTSST